jgi:hypothetical protein
MSSEISSSSLMFYLSGFLRECPAISLAIEETEYIPALNISEGNVLIHPSKREKI